MNSILAFLCKSPNSHMFQHGSVKKCSHLICWFQYWIIISAFRHWNNKKYRLPVKEHQMQENQIVRCTVFWNFNFVKVGDCLQEILPKHHDLWPNEMNRYFCYKSVLLCSKQWKWQWNYLCISDNCEPKAFWWSRYGQSGP